MHLHQLDAAPGLWMIEAETNGYLIVRDGKSLLIDCPIEDISAALAVCNLPLPEVVLHTQVQEEHCREWASLPQVPVYVSVESKEVATISEAFRKEWHAICSPARNRGAREEEEYGIAGCITERQPRHPLLVAGTLEPDSIFQWNEITLKVIKLQGSGKRAIGFYWPEQGILFSGDLVYAGGFLVNIYDQERSYGLFTGYDQLRNSLETALALSPAVMLPTTGQVITDPAGDMQQLLSRVAWVKIPPTRRPDEEPDGKTNFTPLREFGRYKEILPGLFQCHNFGNMIVYIDAEGRGLIVDPDPCVWSKWDERIQEIHRDFDLLEREAGLKRVEICLITHYHGDHVEYCDLIRERYGAEIWATPDIAILMERPAEYRYPCTIDWYGFPFDHIMVDKRIAYDVPFQWHDVTVTPIHTPGHCLAHAGFVIDWQGKRTVCTGDTFQYGSGPIVGTLPFIYNDTAWPDRGWLVTLRKLQALKPDYIVGGHSHCCYDPNGEVVADFIAVLEEAEQLTAKMLQPGTDLLHAMTPPGYDAKRPSMELTAEV